MPKHALSGLFVLLLISVVSLPLFAGREKNVEITRNFILGSGQFIIYDQDLLYPSQSSVYGFGSQAGVYYNINERFALGPHIGYEFFQYSDLMDYCDLKFDLSARIRINRLNNDKFGLFVNCFTGLDLVVREDWMKAVYYMHGCGLSFDVKMNEYNRFNMGCNLAVTYQDGSVVTHVSGYMGITWVRK